MRLVQERGVNVGGRGVSGANPGEGRAARPRDTIQFAEYDQLDRWGNDPSAGSPTETLLRLHLPLNDKVWTGSHSQVPIKQPDHKPEASPDHSIGRCDGRCVQRAGT